MQIVYKGLIYYTMADYKSNEELFIKYQKSRDIDLRNKIVLNNRKLIYPVINKFYNPKSNEYEELEQEAFICLIKAVENYDPNLGFEFSTYATKCLYAINDNKLRYKAEISLDTPIKNSLDDDIDLIDTIEDEEIDIESEIMYSCLNDRIKSILKEDEYKVIKYIYFYELTLAKIQVLIDKPISQVRKLKYTALRKIKNDPDFQEYRYYEASQYNINYISAYDYSKPKVQTSNIANPVWQTVLQREKRDKKVIKGIFKN